MLFAWVDEVQQRAGICGDLFEIGVHHGRSAVFLGRLLRPGEQLGACDLFADQERNPSASGRGDQAIFDDNVRRHLGAGAAVRVHACPSTELNAAAIGVRCRFFHIDGGHNADEALADLRLAAACLLPEGVIAVDDALAPAFPGVTEAIVQFLTADPSFCGAVLGFNKMLIARRAAAEAYGGEIDDPEQRRTYGLAYPHHLKSLPFAGAPLRIFHVPSFVNPRAPGTRLRQWYQHHGWLRSPWLRPLAALARRLVP